MMAKNTKVTKSKETAQLKEQLARALADYDNLKKRLERERLEIEKIIQAKLVARLLPVADMLAEVQKHVGDSGLAIAVSEFDKALLDEGVEKIAVNEGDKFNEELHEAIDTVEADSEGAVAEVLMDGYKIVDGPVVRYAKVKVTTKNKEEKQ